MNTEWNNPGCLEISFIEKNDQFMGWNILQNNKTVQILLVPKEHGMDMYTIAFIGK